VGSILWGVGSAHPTPPLSMGVAGVMNTIKTLEMINISKSFQSVMANDAISLKVSSGEIVGLLGENGAGKTTLMSILYGIYQPDAGEIRINGLRVVFDSPKASIQHGIGMVHQHFMLILNHTVSENVALGYAGAPVLFPSKKIRQRIRSFSEKFNLNIDPDKKIWQLSAGEQQRVEIIKALINDAGLLILDEPTSVLTPQETRIFFKILEKMKNEGKMIILISHKLDEIIRLCDRVIVLRKGQVVGQAGASDLDKRALARLMIGRDVVFSFSKKKCPGNRGCSMSLISRFSETRVSRSSTASLSKSTDMRYSVLPVFPVTGSANWWKPSPVCEL
jgi:general nucleoside transport system ATP-binding protein